MKLYLTEPYFCRKRCFVRKTVCFEFIDKFGLNWLIKVLLFDVILHKFYGENLFFWWAWSKTIVPTLVLEL